MASPAVPVASLPREIRVFISSTFRDMQEEREELVKQIFPQLRRLCESRGVTWGEVDLRWGVPDEAKAEGKVLPLCLQEIEHCRPYFIGLLGERYGWVPEEIPESLFEMQPWLREHLVLLSHRTPALLPLPPPPPRRAQHPPRSRAVHPPGLDYQGRA